MPEIVHEKLPEIMNLLTELTIKIHTKRLELELASPGDENNDYSGLKDLDGYEDSDDSSDEDYDENGGNLNVLFDSRIADIDELQTLKATLTFIRTNNQALYNRMMSGVDDTD